MSNKLATLHECQTVYGVEDVYLLLEVAAVDAHNKRVVHEWLKTKDK